MVFKSAVIHSNINHLPHNKVTIKQYKRNIRGENFSLMLSLLHDNEQDTIRHAYKSMIS